MGENLHKEGDRKNTKKKISNKIYCSTGKNKVSKIANPSKNLLLGLKFNLRLYVFSSSDRLKTLINFRKPVNSPVLSLTLLQIYCIGLIGPISYSFWVWAAICDPTIVDQAISSIESRFEQFQIYEDIFGFLFNFEKLKAIDDNRLKKDCLNLECFFTHETYSDIDCLDLFSELKVLKEVLQRNENSPINVLNYIKRLESFPNACIAFRILLTIHVRVASAE